MVQSLDERFLVIDTEAKGEAVTHEGISRFAICGAGRGRPGAPQSAIVRRVSNIEIMVAMTPTPVAGHSPTELGIEDEKSRIHLLLRADIRRVVANADFAQCQTGERTEQQSDDGEGKAATGRCGFGHRA